MLTADINTFNNHHDQDDYDDDEAKKFGEEIGFGGADNFRDIFNNVDVEIGEGSETSDDLLNDLLQEIGQDFGGLDFDFNFNTNSSSSDFGSGNDTSILNIDDIYDQFSVEWDQGLEVNPIVFYSMSLLYSLFIVLGVVGNGVILYAILSKSIMRTARNYFIVSLAVSDLVLCSVTMPLTLWDILSHKWPFEEDTEWLCQLAHSCQGVPRFMSSMAIVAIAADRYRLIMQPERPQFGPNTALFASFLMFLSAIALSIPMFVSAKVKPFIEFSEFGNLSDIVNLSDILVCQDTWEGKWKMAYTVITSLAQFLLPFAVVIAIYLSIFLKLRKRPKSQHAQNNTRRRRANQMIVAITLIFFFSWLPLNAFKLLVDAFPDVVLPHITGKEVVIYAFLHLCGLANAIVNPFLYGYLNENFRKEYRNIFRRMPWFSASSDVQQVHLHVVASDNDLERLWPPPQPPQTLPGNTVREVNTNGGVVGDGDGNGVVSNGHAVSNGAQEEGHPDVFHSPTRELKGSESHSTTSVAERVDLVISSAEFGTTIDPGVAAMLIRQPGLARRLSMEPTAEEEEPRADGGRRISLPGLGVVLVRAKRRRPMVALAEEEDNHHGGGVGQADCECGGEGETGSGTSQAEGEAAAAAAADPTEEQDRLLRMAAAQEDLHVIVVASRSRSTCAEGGEEGEEQRACAASSPSKPPRPKVFSRQLSMRDLLLKRRLLVRSTSSGSNGTSSASKLNCEFPLLPALQPPPEEIGIRCNGEIPSLGNYNGGIGRMGRPRPAVIFWEGQEETAV